MFAQFYLVSPINKKVDPVKGETGNPVVICPKIAALATAKEVISN